jgi:outer membrane protein TolC
MNLNALEIATFCLALVAPVLSADEPLPQPLSLEEAISRALSRNYTIAIERDVFRASADEVRRLEGAYDIEFDWTSAYERQTDPVNSLLSGAPVGAVAPDLHSLEGSLSFSRLLPTGGTVSILASGERDTTNNTFALLSPSYSTAIGIEVHQPLLRDRAIDPARLRIRVARSERERSLAAFKRTLADTLAGVETAYWGLTAARREIDVRAAAVALAGQQLSETKDRITAGTLPENEEAQPRAELERRKGELLAAEEQAIRAENALKALVLDSGDDPLWSARIAPADAPETEDVSPPSAEALLAADRNRPEVEEAKAALERRETEHRAAEDGRKPRLDAFASYTRRGLSGSANPEAAPFPGAPATVPPSLDGAFGRSIGTIGDGLYPDARVGVTLSLPLTNRAAHAALAIGESQERQARAELARVRQVVRVEVLDAVAGVETTAERIGAARAAREAAESQFQSEEERFRVGLSTNFLVLTRQNDLSRARLDEIQALTDHRKALTELAHASGRLLEDRHVVVEEEASVRAASGGSK